MDDKILILNKVSKQYPGVLALDRVDFDVIRGETHALIGENGAGKSTLIKVLSGAIVSDEGDIEFDGHKFEHISPAQSRKLGISVIYQEFNLMETLTVAENVFVGNLPTKNKLIDKNAMYDNALKIFDTMGVKINVKEKVGDLSVAYMQFVEIAKALSQNAKLLIMDEPTAPLTSHETEVLFDIMKRLKENGISIIFISHRLDEVFQVADRVTVLRDGCKISCHNTHDVTKSDLIRDMVGRTLSETFPERDSEIGEVVLSVENLSGNGVKNVSFQLHRGEILGFMGLVGAGRTEIMRVLCGIDKKSAGEVYLKEKQVNFTSPRDALKSRIAMVPEDRKRQGTLLSLSISQNISLPNLNAISNKGILNSSKEEKLVNSQVDALKVACYSNEQIVETLSGGNQQKIVLAKWLASHVNILVMDEPTRGIDVGAKYEIYQLMRRLCREGISIVMISSEMEEIIGMSDRIIVLFEGKQVGEVTKKDFSQEKLLTIASGYESN